MPDTNRIRPKPLSEALGQSEAFLSFQERLSRVAKVDRPVLIVGERGTGKELAAARLHYLSPRWTEPLLALNCAALPANLIESELFGYEAGAFTGAMRRRIGRFEAADRGILFLDEIGNIPLEVQTRILRTVEYGTFERVGSSTPVQVDVRIIGATNADLPELAATGRFQADLLDRLSFEVLYLPPLRERTGDIRLLANHFAARMAHELGRPGIFLAEEACQTLETYSWPGNIRELKNVVERAVARTDREVVVEVVFDPFPRLGAGLNSAGTRFGISEAEVPPTSRGHPRAGVDLSRPLTEQVADLEKKLLRTALAQARHNQRRAAEILGLTYHQFRGLYRRHAPVRETTPEEGK